MSFPPFPPTTRYSPSHAYADQPYPSPGSLPPFPPNSAPPPPPPTAGYRPYDAYGSEPPRQPFPYQQPGRPYESEAYDPYQPSSSSSSAYDPIAPQMRLPTTAYLPPRPEPSRAPPRHAQPPLAQISPYSPQANLPILTGPTTVEIDRETIPIYSLPPSHLPLQKYVAMNSEDAIAIHRQLCRNAVSSWYAGASSRAGEGWSAAVEWVIDSRRSGSKMRGCLGDADGLETELGGICKAVEGFQELLSQSLKEGKPMSHELIVFSDSQAAIVAIDTSSRPESLRFENLWREICSEFMQAKLILAWLPPGTDIEGLTLANKIATVGASNSYSKRKKEGTLPDIYRRPGGGDPAPSGSSFAGPWQRGDADPSRRKHPFERPRLPLPRTSPGLELGNGHGHSHEPVVPPPEYYPAKVEPEDESGQPKEGSIFVTHFSEEVSAKDLGILFAQYGNIVGVDIYHISPQHPRFAFVTYTDMEAGGAAIHDLHHKKINLDTPFAKENEADLAVWARFPGQLTVVRAEPPRLVPRSMEPEFPNLPDWATGGIQTQEPGLIASDGPELSAESIARKRDRTATATPGPDVASNATDSPRKKARQSPLSPLSRTESKHIPQPEQVKTEVGDPVHDKPTPHPTQAGGQLPATHPVVPHALPPFPPSIKREPGRTFVDPSPAASQTARLGSPILPPTPQTAERTPAASSDRLPSPASLPRSDSGRGMSKSRLTNSASEPQEYPIKVGAKTLRSQLDLVRRSFVKVDVSNWIGHACFIASEIDQSRRALQEDLYHTDNGFITGRELEKTLATRGFTPERVDAFINKVLKVLDGIAMAEEEENGVKVDDPDDVAALEKELEVALAPYPDQTKEAIESASKLMEYLIRGKEAQDRKRLEIERRVKVLEGMVNVGEVVGGVVRFLLSDSK